MYGYDSFQELQNLKYYLLKLNPDILILHRWNEEFEFSALGTESILGLIIQEDILKILLLFK